MMKKPILFILLAVLCFLPAMADKPADFDKKRSEIMTRLAELERRSLTADSRSLAAAEKTIVVKPGTSEISVDCDTGQSVNKALGRHLSRYVIVNLSGTCRETILVERPGITLSGTLAGGATIDPPEGPAIKALWAHELTLVDVTLTGATDGLYALASRGMVLERVRAVDNSAIGLILDASGAEITDSELSRNEVVPLYVLNQSTATVRDSLIQDNTYAGPWVIRQSTLRIYDSTLTGNGLNDSSSYYVAAKSYAILENSILGAPGEATWIGLQYGSHLRIVTSEVFASAWVGKNSYLEIISTSTFGSEGQNREIWAVLDSVVDVGRSSITADIYLYSSSRGYFWNPNQPIRGDVFIFELGEGGFYTGAPIEGGIYCWDRGRAHCTPHPLEGVHGCE